MTICKYKPITNKDLYEFELAKHILLRKCESWYNAQLNSDNQIIYVKTNVNKLSSKPLKQ